MQHRHMPTKLAILYHWHTKLSDMPDSFHEAKQTWLKTCWGCGFEGNIERCHVLAKSMGGPDTVENLVLLCDHCHVLQEKACVTDEGRSQFMESLIDGAPFMSVRLRALQAAYEMMPSPQKQVIIDKANNYINNQVINNHETLQPSRNRDIE